MPAPPTASASARQPPPGGARRGRRLGTFWLGAGLLSIGLLLAGETAHACSGTLSSCFDANNLDLPIAPGRLMTLEDADTQLAPKRISAAVAMSYLHEPVVLTAASPDPAGRSIPLVDHVWQTDLLFAVGVLDTLQVGLGVPIRLYQTGGGIEAATARVGDTLSTTVLADPRLGVGWQAFRGPVTGRLRFEVKLPLGDQEAFAGAPGPTFMPALSLSASQWGPWYLAAEVAGRFRSTTQLGDVRMGNQLRVGLGVRYAIWQELSVGLEAWALPSLLAQPRTPYGRARHLPAEWLASLRAPLGSQFWLQLGAGSGLPLSSQGSDPTGGERETFLGVTTPDFRALVEVRFVESE